MKHTLLIAATATALLAGCASTTEQTAPPATNADARFTDCTLPTLADDRGPIRPSLFVVGTFPEGQWIHLDNHKMGYKGDGIYQVVVDEKAGNVSLQFATMSWTPQFTASGMAMTVGQLNELKRGGFAKNTVVNIPKDGKYVWTIQIAADKTPLLAMISECQ
ncbi:glycosidase [Vibrio cholerae]|uniref:glycosidase n=1 Tax=Vibrio cholerae TaxID=666 RepID=UPI00155EEDE5|nr:glycosidase [Vibrio cholerae]EGR4175294.1 glycosidase [Vibrio cholerae]EGR4278717.1 glycosidase [Vibrio cholerae]NOE78721.1 glycosidase [Vibrio cholerae]